MIRESGHGGARRRFGAALLLSTALIPVLPWGPAVAQQAAIAQEQRNFDIPAQQLSTALVLYGRQAGLQVSVDAAAVRGVAAPEVRGTLTSGAALERLLAGSDLAYRLNGRAVVIAARGTLAANPAAGAGAVVLETIDVTGGTGGAGLRGSAWQPSPDEIYETPASVANIDAGTITSHGHNLNNAVRSVAGVYSWENAAQPGMAVNIRGLEGMGRVTSTIDGVRQNYRFTGHGPAGYTYVEPSLISGIDITKGAIATAGGAGTLAGAVNYRTLTVDDVLLPHEKAAAQITATFGGNKNDDMSVTKAGGVRFDLAGNENGGSVFGAVNLTSVGNYEDGDGTLVNNSWRDVKSGLLKVSLSPNDEHRLDLGGVFYTTDFVANFYGQTVTNKTFTARYAYTPDSNLIDLRVNGYLNRTQSEWKANPGSSIVVTTYDGRVMTTDSLGFDVTNTSRWDFDGYGLKLDYGVEYYRDDFSGNSKADANPDGISGVGGGFVQGTLSAGMFELIPALRYDIYTMDSSGTTGNVPENYWTIQDHLTGSTRDTLTRPSNAILNNTTRYTVTETPFDAPWRGDFDIDETKFKLSPKVTLAAKPFEWLQVYGTYEESFRAPTVNEMFFGGSHGSGVNASFLPNPALRPEEAKGWEFGANILRNGIVTQDDALRLKTAWYQKDIKNFIISHCFGSGSMCWFENAPGTSRLRGVEVDASYDIGWGFAGLAYARNRSDLEFGYGIGGMGEPSRLPDDYMTLTAGVRLLDRKLTLGARMNDVAKGTLVQDSWETSAYTTYDLFMNYQPSDRLNLFANVTNLTDVNYMPAMSQDRAPGRRIFGGATVKLGEGPLFGQFEGPVLGGVFGNTVSDGDPANGRKLWDGLHVGIAGGYSWAEANTDRIVPPDTRSPLVGFIIPFDTRGYSGKLGAGYDHQFDSGLVLGADAGFSFGDVSLGQTTVWTGVLCCGGVDRRRYVDINSRLEWSGELRGRAGYSMGTYLPFLTAGVTWARYSHSFEFSDASAVTVPAVPGIEHDGRTYIGWTIGAGLEKAITEKLSLRGEYSYSDYGRESGYAFRQTSNGSTYDIDGEYGIDLRRHDFKVGVSYRF